MILLSQIVDKLINKTHNSKNNMANNWGARLAAGIGGIATLIALFLPVMHFEVTAAGFGLTEVQLTLLNIGEVVDLIGGDAENLLFLMAIIALGGIMLLVGATGRTLLMYLGAIVQLIGVGILINNLYFGDISVLGTGISTSPGIGLYMLLAGTALGLLTFIL